MQRTTEPSQDALVFANASAWEVWLSKHHADDHIVWLCIAKKGHEHRALGYDEALDVALCFGWIDGQRKANDAGTFLQRFTQRRARSNWSARNLQKIQQLQADGRMQPAGAAALARAISNPSRTES
jgi:uncharacterized protein YdeI (YjbR/CyaY-like superfamily)